MKKELRRETHNIGKNKITKNCKKKIKHVKQLVSRYKIITVHPRKKIVCYISLVQIVTRVMFRRPNTERKTERKLQKGERFENEF